MRLPAVPTELLHIFDPRRNFQTQGFTGRAATTTMHDATETGVSISGIFQAAEDFALLGWWSAPPRHRRRHGRKTHLRLHRHCRLAHPVLHRQVPRRV
jgi:hypothetical protein